MNKKRLLLVSPIIISSALLLSGCKEEDKKETKAPTNIRIENKVLKWDLPFSVENPVTEVKLNDKVVACNNATSLNLNNFIDYSGKLNVTLKTKAKAFKGIYKNTEVSKSFDVKALEAPKIDPSYDLFSVTFNFDGKYDSSRKFEVLRDGKLVKDEKLYEISSSETEKVVFQIKEVSKDANIFDSPYISKVFSRLRTPKTKIEDGVLKWDKVPYANSYGVKVNTNEIKIIDTNEFDLKYTLNKGDTIIVCAFSEFSNPYYLTSLFSEKLIY